MMLLASWSRRLRVLHVVVAAITVAATVALRAAPACAQGPAEASPPANPIRAGAADRVADLDGLRLQVFTFRPSRCTVTRILLVFHGTDRDAPRYREDATPLAQRLCLLVVAPYFDLARFPPWAYELGGLVERDAVLPESRWTVSLVPRLVAWVRAQEGRADLPYALLGHSGGAQLVDRVTAFTAGGAAQAVIVSPGSWVRPRLDIAAPYGFAGAFRGAAAEQALRRYLATPVTVLVGALDIGTHYRVEGDQPDELGMNRLERTQFVFHEAEQVARTHRWAFGWRLAIVPGVGHSDIGMIGSAEALEAVGR